jgi:transmembrane sensor
MVHPLQIHKYLVMDQEEINRLIEKYKIGTATDQERDTLNLWYRNTAYSDVIYPDEEKATETRILSRLLSEITPATKIKRWKAFTAAASVILGLSVGSYFLLNKQGDQQLVEIKTHDIAPGSNKAILTLANGKQIILNNAQDGELVQQGNAAITKSHDGHIIYQASDKGASSDIAYNTTTTPRGGEYHITLADGTGVWLNAASSITYPTVFSGRDRTVEITGEAYFEVAHNAAKPFRVKSNGQTVQVLGTHFDVNAYDDESTIKTTLLEGSVKVTTGEHVALLQPGQQSQVSIAEKTTGVFKGIQNVDTDEAVAWKNGSFQFDKDDIKTVMRQFSRWYDVDVVYQGDIKERAISGSMHRNLSAAKALELLSLANVHFIIDGKKIIVSE